MAKRWSTGQRRYCRKNFWPSAPRLDGALSIFYPGSHLTQLAAQGHFREMHCHENLLAFLFWCWFEISDATFGWIRVFAIWSTRSNIRRFEHLDDLYLSSIRGERKWHLGVREREQEWIIPFPNGNKTIPKFGNGKGTKKKHSQNTGMGKE